jgi:hypothetical protein
MAGGAGKQKERDIIADLRKKKTVAVVRLYDSSSVARGTNGMPIIPAQPADMVLLKYDPFIEVKTTESSEEWDFNRLNDKQHASCMLYGCPQSKIKYYVLLYSLGLDKYWLIPAKFIYERQELIKVKASTWTVKFHELDAFSIKFEDLEKHIWESDMTTKPYLTELPYGSKDEVDKNGWSSPAQQDLPMQFVANLAIQVAGATFNIDNVDYPDLKIKLKNVHVLDIGAGTGKLGDLVQGIGVKYTAVDIRPEACAILLTKGHTCKSIDLIDQPADLTLIGYNNIISFLGLFNQFKDIKYVHALLEAVMNTDNDITIVISSLDKTLCDFCNPSLFYINFSELSDWFVSKGFSSIQVHHESSIFHSILVARR